MIELCKTAKCSKKFDRMISSESSWLMGIKTKRLVGQAHAVIEPGKSIPIWKFHYMTGLTGEHLLRTTAENMDVKFKGKLEPCEICPQAKIRQAQYGIEVKYIKLDNRGENRSLQKECEKQNLGIIFELTSPGTPQQNSVVERKKPILMGRSRAMMIEAGFSQQDKRKFWCEVISTATKLDNIMVRKERSKPPYTLFYNADPKHKKYLRSFGEMAVIAISDGKKMRSKLDTRGRTG